MRTRILARSVLTLAACGLAGLLPRAADAQIDTNPPIPNVMLLVDTSGSMEYTLGQPGASPVLPVCTPNNTAGTNQRSRWIHLVSVLTGEIQNYSCEAQTRSDAAFKSEFALASVDPYDSTYYLPHHRIISNGCKVGPNPTTWPDPSSGNVYPYIVGPRCKPTDTAAACSRPFREHLWNDNTTACSTAFGQNPDGILDAFKDRARFGLMTFDPDPENGTGITGTNQLKTASPFGGLWSYYNGWSSGSNTYATGRPVGCATTQKMEVGARNPAAPPWEGRLIPFGSPDASGSENQDQNQRIQDTLLTMRPYGATPTNGLLADAEFFFTSDTSADPQDPTNASKHFGPSTDPLVTGGCRDQFVILLTDGEPNLDFRPECTGVDADPTKTGKCPFPDTSETIVSRLLQQKNIKTFVIGFAVSTSGSSGPSQVQCDAINGVNSPDAGNKCTNAELAAHPERKVCCELAKIAYAGGTTNAQYADSPDSLRVALNNVLSKVASKSTSRTTPAFSSAPSIGSGSVGVNDTPVASFQFLSSFFVSQGALWAGVLERQRYMCKNVSGSGWSAEPQSIDESKGDSFSSNLNSASASTRKIYTFQPTTAADQALVTRTLRATPPGTSDGLGTRTGVLVAEAPATFVSSITPETLSVGSTGAATSSCSSAYSTVDANTCRTRILKWELGLPPDAGTTFTREGSVFGSIYHSTPTLVPRPSDYVRDESYQTFVQAQKDRPLMLYTATTDGQLHAFKVTAATSADTIKVDKKENNELWSFMPPAVMPGLRTLYPGVQKNLLDGAPVVRDVVYRRNKAQVNFDSSATAQTWNTALVAGFGGTFGGYYALDITNPVPTSTAGPKFLWQLSTAEDSSGSVALFGKSSTTPAIATIYLDDGSGKQEVSVAILPGGDGTPTGVGCDQASTTGVDSYYPPRAKTRCYAGTDQSRSLTVVRLDNGEVIRTFRPQAAIDVLPGSLKTRAQATGFTSPVVGIPVAYPTGTGVLSNRVFVGDRDGNLWRLDLSSPNPSNWNVSLFFDLYSPKDLPGSNETTGQPIMTPPVLSVDSVGNIVVIASTGEQDQITASTGMKNSVWSITEETDVTTGTIKSKANWHLGLNESYASSIPTGVATDWTNGERVTGPISLFNGVVYFSTFRPATNASLTCSGGTSTLWGVDYLTRTDSSRNAPPKGRLVLDPSGSIPSNAPPAQNQGDAIIFGVAVVRTPTCFTEQGFSDAYFGMGSSSGMTDLAPGGFQLLVQTGSIGSSSAGGSTNNKSFRLPTPPPSVRIDSWAAIVE